MVYSLANYQWIIPSEQSAAPPKDQKPHYDSKSLQNIVSCTTELMSLINSLEALLESVNYTRTFIYPKSGSSALELSDKIERSLDPLQALRDIGSLFEAHTIKLGIAFKPPVSTEAALKCISDITGLLPLLTAVYSQTSDEDDGTLIRSEIRVKLADLLSAASALGLELLTTARKQDENQTKSGDASSNGQLISIGQVWECCKKLQKLHVLGPQGILSEKIDEFSSILKDAKEDLTTWTENDSDGLGWDLSDGEDLDEPTHENNDHETPRNEEIEALAKTWIDKITKLDILYQAIQKRRLSHLDKSSSIQLHVIMGEISRAIDDLVAGFLEGFGKRELESQAEAVNSVVKKLLDVVKQNEPQDKFAAWSSMFTQNFFKRD
jgi:hypothetical protein